MAAVHTLYISGTSLHVYSLHHYFSVGMTSGIQVQCSRFKSRIFRLSFGNCFSDEHNFDVSGLSFNPFTSRGDQYVTSSYIINTLLARQVMRIKRLSSTG